MRATFDMKSPVFGKQKLHHILRELHLIYSLYNKDFALDKHHTYRSSHNKEEDNNQSHHKMQKERVI